MGYGKMLLEKAAAAVKQYNMIAAGETVCAAFSGGADSAALLLALSELSERLDFRLTAVHVNHLLRGEESDRDESFCRGLCEKMNIPLTVFREDAAAFSRSAGVSVETGARELKYRLFDTLPADKIAAAHNLNDNAETVLFRLARGTGLRGMAGIPPVRGKIIRPLLFCTRSEIEEFLKERGQDFVTDSTNLTDDYARNRIRHRIMPEMSAVHGGFPENITVMTASFAEDEDFITGEALKHADDDLRTLHTAVRKRVIINLLKSHKLKTSAGAICEIDSTLKNGGRVSLNDGYCAVCDKGKVRIVSSEFKKEKPPQPLQISGEGKYSFYGDKIVIITKGTDENVNVREIINKNLTSEYADYDKIQGGMLLRNRLRSDRIKPAGQPHTKELRKLLQERLPREEREISAVIEDSGGIVWAEHAGVADRVKPCETTRAFIKFEVYRDDKKGLYNLQ